ncbi:MAG: PilZ domain-containing protein [Lachnospiraceae bacterium]|nr:PilZ domain-containing protein [Lachnospiraceae bacterium]
MLGYNQRKNRRIALDAEITMKPIGSNVQATPMKVEIEDVSKNGIGFVCDEILSPGSTYEAKLRIWTDETMDVFLQIVRGVQVEKRWQYGAIFIGMSDVDASRIQTYQTILELHEKEAAKADA